MSQGGRAMLCVVEYFVKSFKITQGHWNGIIRKFGHGFLFVFHIIFSRFDTIHKCDGQPSTARQQGPHLWLASR